MFDRRGIALSCLSGGYLNIVILAEEYEEFLVSDFLANEKAFIKRSNRQMAESCFECLMRKKEEESNGDFQERFCYVHYNMGLHVVEWGINELQRLRKYSDDMGVIIRKIKSEEEE